jgi:hypothetical protein
MSSMDLAKLLHEDSLALLLPVTAKDMGIQ